MKMIVKPTPKDCVDQIKVRLGGESPSFGPVRKSN